MSELVDISGTLIWKTRDGRLVKVTEMDATHLRNAYRWAGRRAEESRSKIRKQYFAHAQSVFYAEMVRRGWKKQVTGDGIDDAEIVE